MTDEEIWRWIIGDESPLVVASEFRERGTLTCREAAWELLDARGWILLQGVVLENGLTVEDIKVSITRTLREVAWMPEFATEYVALLRHFDRLNPQPSWIWLPLCRQALDAAIDGDLERELRVPPYRDDATMPAVEVLKQFKINPGGVFGG